jgi:hypothetical protein
MRSYKICIFIVDTQQMKVHVKHKAPCVLRVNFQFSHRLYLSALYVEKLEVYESMQ